MNCSTAPPSSGSAWERTFIAPRIVCRAFPGGWKLDLHQRPRGVVIYLRRTDACGAIRVLGHRLEVDAQWMHRLVRAEVDLEAGQIRCYRLRRRTPDEQPLLRTIPYVFPQKQFHPT